MKLDRQVWRTLVSSVRLGKDTYRVIRPARPMAHAPLYESRHGAQLTVDKTAAKELAIAWWLAARSPRSLVYLPLRSSEASCGEGYGGPKLDLVLLHHSLQFPVSQWKSVRARLKNSAPQTIKPPTNTFPTFEPQAHREWSHQGYRDHLRWDITADTLFLVGSRHAYELEGGQLRELAEDCPAHLAESPGAHCCAEVNIGRMKLSYPDGRSPWADLHVECCDSHW